MRTSESLSALAPALVKAAAELTNPKKDAENPFFKSRYTRLDKLIDHLRPVLASHGLCAVQSAGDGVTTMIVHESGEWIASEPLHITPVKNDPQGVAGAITYARRYSLAAICGVEGEGDDDGNHASGNAGQQQGGGQQQRPQSAPPPQTGGQQQRPPQQGAPSGGVDPVDRSGGDEGGFEMDHYPAHKSGAHVFAKGPNAERWNGMVWRDLQEWHRTNPGDSPLVAIYESEYMALWNKQHAAYLASVQPAPQDDEPNLDSIPF